MRIEREYHAEYAPVIVHHQIQPGILEQVVERIEDPRNDWHIPGGRGFSEQMDKAFDMKTIINNAVHLRSPVYIDVTVYRKDNSPDTDRLPSQPGNMVVTLKTVYCVKGRVAPLPRCVGSLIRDLGFKEWKVE